MTPRPLTVAAAVALATACADGSPPARTANDPASPHAAETPWDPNAPVVSVAPAALPDAGSAHEHHHHHGGAP